jgi:ATP-dependent Clp protease ATP-binding subunit ClpC
MVDLQMVKEETVDFKNTIIIMTSNVGVSSLNQKPAIGFETKDQTVVEKERNKEIIQKAIKEAFAPEFINRLDEVIMFNSLTEENIEEITRLMLEETKERLEKIGIEINFNKRVIKFLAKEGFNKEYGARPLERHITKMIDNTLAEEILNGKLSKDMVINLTIKEGKINFSNKKEKNSEEKEEVLSSTN